VIINTKSNVDHDTSVGDYSYVSVAHLAGGAYIDESVLLGLHSVVLPSLHVGARATFGAGAVVTKNVKPNTTVVGIPARA
jgi:acetyltransferase EpsM